MSPELIITLLGIYSIIINEASINNKGEFIVNVSSTMEGAHCEKCGRKLHKQCQSHYEVKLRHLSIFGHETYIIINPLRYECEHCNTTTTQKLDWYEQRHTCTKAYEDHILLTLINSTIEDVSIKEKISYDIVQNILDHRISEKIDWNTIQKIDTLGIDEITLKKGHKDFVTIITAFINGQLRIIAVLKNREKATIKEFFLSIPKRLRKTVKAVCSDLYVGFINAAKEVFGKKVRIIADRFHVARLYRDDLDTLRKQEMKRLKKKLKTEEYEKLKNIMWILRKSPKDLTEEELNTMKLLFKHSPNLELAYQLTLNLTGIFNMNINQGAAKMKIKEWMRRVKKSGITCFNGFLKTLSSWMQEITNYFVDRCNSGFVEGVNNKIKVIKRRCYGVTNIDRLFKRIWLDLEGYRNFNVL